MSIQLPIDKLKATAKVLAWPLIGLILIALLWYSCRPAVVPTGAPEVPIKATSSTSVSVEPKTSASDNDLEVTHAYTASIDGQKVTIPINPVTMPNGPKGVVKQEIDFTPVVQKMVASEVAKEQKNWSLGVGIGIHKGDIYIPVEIERTYSRGKVDKALAIEVHLKPEVPPKVNGGEIKHKWKF